MDNLLQHLKEFGFNAYESKVYLSLLKHHPATGYEVSKESGVPQARAYDTLKVLENKKIVVSCGTKPITYLPINPEELLKNCERSYKASLNYLRENLPSLSNDFIEPVINIRGENSINDCIKGLIQRAKKEIFIEIWNEDFIKFENDLKAANERGVDVKIVGYNNVKADFGLVYQHALGESIETSLGGRWIVFTVDNEEGIAGTVSAIDKTPDIVCTRNAGLVLIMKEVVVHDMFLLDVESNLGEALSKVYGKNLVALRDKILGKNFNIKTH
jgi:sugar-specific transcriptional regulator TrmB